MVSVYIADVSGLNIDSAISRVTEYRRSKALRLPTDEKKRQSLGAELLLYGAINGGEAFEYQIGENGKPFLDGSQSFSLSHCGDYAVCAVSDSPIGVDIERKREGSASLARRFFTDSECRLIEESPDRDDKFCELWVIKESYIKALGTGLNTPLSSFTAAEKIAEYSTSHFVYMGYHIAVCMKAPKLGEITVYDKKIF